MGEYSQLRAPSFREKQQCLFVASMHLPNTGLG